MVYLRCVFQRLVELVAGHVGLLGGRVRRLYRHRRPHPPPRHAGRKAATQGIRDTTHVLGDADEHRVDGGRAYRLGVGEPGTAGGARVACLLVHRDMRRLGLRLGLRTGRI